MRLKVRAPASYEEQTYESPYWIVRFPHQRRYQFAIDEILASNARTLLDYGTGDAHMLIALHQRQEILESFGYEPVLDLAADARRRVAVSGLGDRIRILSHVSECEGMQFDCITCLGVLEHMPLPQRELFYDTCEERLAPGGVVVIDVPVEIGPTVLIKEVVRRILKGRLPEYTIAELARRVAGARYRDPGRFDPANESTWIHFHQNFDHRLLLDELAARFRVKRTYPSPFRRMPAALANQEVFIVLSRR